MRGHYTPSIHHAVSKNLWPTLFRCHGSIWSSVLPYCFLNCTILCAVEALSLKQVKISFSPTGHGLMTLMISYLVISKVNLAYERYMEARRAIGHALASLRELNQLLLVYTKGHSDIAKLWRVDMTNRIIDLIDCTVRVIRDEQQADYLARNGRMDINTGDDPLMHLQALRLHIYRDDRTRESNLQLLERLRLLDELNFFSRQYMELLKLASTPLPFPLVQMARTFLFIWTFSIPLALRGVVDDFVVEIIFVFFLTYGFIGLELVATKLMYPFGDDVNDLNVTGMREATLSGLERDIILAGEEVTPTASTSILSDRRLDFDDQLPRYPTVNTNMFELQAMNSMDPNADMYRTDSSSYSTTNNNHNPRGGSIDMAPSGLSNRSTTGHYHSGTADTGTASDMYVAMGGDDG